MFVNKTMLELTAEAQEELKDITNKDLLIASYILPYSKCKNKNDMINYNSGLLLCPMHDALFDIMSMEI